MAKILVFGAGLIGARHIKEVAALGYLAGIVDPSAGQDLAQSYGVPHFSAPTAALAGVRPDGVIIATPNHLHGVHAEVCLNAGVPVLIEKPLADTLEGAHRIEKAARDTGVAVLVGHHRRHNPIIAKAKEIIAEGGLGNVVAASGHFWLYKPDDYFLADWRNKTGAGPCFINLVHDVDLMRYLCGDIVDVQAMRSNRQRGSDVEDTAAILLRFESGALGSFTVSDTVVAPWSWEMTSGENPIYPHVRESCYQIGGTQASLSLPELRIWSHPGARSWWEPIEAVATKVDAGDAFQLQLAHFLEVLAGAPPLVTAEEGRKSLQVVLEVAQGELR